MSTAGLIFTLFNPEMYQPESSAHSTWDGRVPSKDDFSSYHVSVSKSYTAADGTKYSADMDADATQQIFNKNLYPWAMEGDEADSTLLHESTVEEECVRIAEGFVDIPKLVEFAFTSHPEYLEFDSVKAILRKRTTVSMPDEAFEGEEASEDIDWAAAPVEDVGGGDGPLVATSPTDDEFAEEVGGEIEAEVASADSDEEFDEFAQTFVEDNSFEEDEDKSVEFDPEAEADEVSEAMDKSLNKASSALAKSAKRKSPKRELKRPDSK